MRDWWFTRWLLDLRTDWLVSIAEVVSLAGDLVVVVAVLGALVAIDYLRSVAADPTAPGCSQRAWWLVAVVLGGLTAVVQVESLIPRPRPPAAATSSPRARTASPAATRWPRRCF